MNTLYLTFKFLHIVGAIVWLGGMVTVSVLSAFIARERSLAVLATLTRLNQSFGSRVVGPAAGLTLIAGVVMAVMGGIGGPLWVIWGVFAIVVSILLGATVLRVTAQRLIERLGAAEAGDTELRRLQRQMALWGFLNLLVLFSAEWAMVFKPTL